MLRGFGEKSERKNKGFGLKHQGGKRNQGDRRTGKDGRKTFPFLECYSHLYSLSYHHQCVCKDFFLCTSGLWLFIAWVRSLSTALNDIFDNSVVRQFRGRPLSTKPGS